MRAVKAKARVKTEPYRNDTEKRYAERLESMRVAKQILRWDYEPESLRLGEGASFKPDFRVIASDGTVEFHEVKGGLIREAAMVRLKVAADRHPYAFFLCQYKKKQWYISEVAA